MEKTLNSIPGNIRLMITSTTPLVIVIILFLLVGQFGISKIIDLNNQINKSKKDQTVLSQKLNLLQSLADTAAQDSGFSLTAMPDSNPSLVVVSQIKTVSSANGVLISGIKSGSAIDDNSGLTHASITFQATGPRAQVVSFLKSMVLTAPIVLVDKLKMNETAGVARADITIRTYWAALPKSLPTLDKPILDLTAAEKKTLQDVASLNQPTFVVVPPSTGSGKTDPFAQ